MAVMLAMVREEAEVPVGDMKYDCLDSMLCW
jgi:hypothetical protein